MVLLGYLYPTYALLGFPVLALCEFAGTGGFMAAKKAMKGKSSAKARSLRKGKKLEEQKSLKKGAPVPYLNITMTTT
jgi:hypothetical protein